ncbi:methyltransferase domain-containing protein [Marinobacter sp. NP-4(2019)]|uniref:methyltransferase domain-containing protein n=1 Tax=Marinobacter sp. NP-4(2019) TaxID=2488665 RepID=UPI000FC3D979|nr:methyltransferase domain-containing protein [Marinobacter sp. NP-4(2019)]AZT82211.1 methyltransferase domain-containing protein [Marinobacter sp. NP-4(2019)]
MVHDQVKDYYGKVLQKTDDLQTNACCTDEAMPNHLKPIIGKIHDEVLTKYYGCGLVTPEQLEGMRILDLGSGSGRDVYALAALVGESGEVVGVDMTDEQLEVARRHVDYHAEVFGFTKPNVRFLKGYIEKLNELDLEPGSFDIIVSNCVINLSPDKPAVLREAYRLLKPGGEMYFSDVYSDRRIPASLVNDPVLYGECLSGALYWNDFENMAKAAGFADPRLVTDSPITINNSAQKEKTGPIRFFSATYRLFKLEGLEPACEDYGQAVIYRGTIAHHPHQFDLDKHHAIPAGKVFPVCGNTHRMLKDTRFAEHFEFIGDGDTHFGIFKDCGTDVPFGNGDDQGDDEGASQGGCC